MQLHNQTSSPNKSCQVGTTLFKKAGPACFEDKWNSLPLGVKWSVVESLSLKVDYESKNSDQAGGNGKDRVGMKNITPVSWSIERLCQL